MNLQISTIKRPHFQEHLPVEGIGEVYCVILLSIFFKHLTAVVSDTSVLNPPLYIWFQMTAPRYLIPFFSRPDLTAGMCKWIAVLVLWSWISILPAKMWQIYLEYYLCGIHTWNEQSSIYLYHEISLFSAYNRKAENWFRTLHGIS